MKTLTRVALIATIATYLLIFIGGLVRVSGAGLGCPDWPHCFGQWLPPTSNEQLHQLIAAGHGSAANHDIDGGFDLDPSKFNVTLAWIEYLNRLVGVALGLIIIAACALALRREARRRADILWPILLSLPLVIITGWMGKEVVEAELHPTLVSLHLFMALLVVSLLLYGTLQAHRRTDIAPAPLTPRVYRLSWLIVGVWALTLIQLIIGASVRGQVDTLLRQDPQLLASGELLHQVDALKHIHVLLGLAVAAVSYFLTLRIMRRRDELPTAALYIARLILALVLAQVILGFAFGQVGLMPILKVFHLWLASIIAGLWVVLYVVLRRGAELPAMQPRAFIRWGVGGILTAIIMGLIATVTISHAEASRANLPIYGTLPHFQFQAVQGGTFQQIPDGFDHTDLQGRYTIACFMFTRCPSICPIQTKVMADLNRAYAGADRLQFLSISVDPDYDTIDVLQEFAAKYYADENWYFVRGDIDATKQLAGPDGFVLRSDFPNHSPKLVLIDPQGQIRGYYDSLDREKITLLRRDLTKIIGPATAE